MKLSIQEKIESQNKFNNRRGIGAQFAYRKYRDNWKEQIMVALPLGARNSHGDNRFMVTITSYRSRLLDKGNLYGGSKPILDALIHFGVIRDDSPKWCEEEVKQVKCARKDEKTEIEVIRISE